MLQVIEQTKEEMIDMYLKCTKRKLAEMLYECNRILSQRPPQIVYPESSCDICGSHPSELITTSAGRFCKNHVQY